MTGLVTFGDQLEAARRLVDQAGGGPWLRGGRDLPDVARSMHALVLAIGSCLRDIGERDSRVPAGDADPASCWPVARVRARRAAFLAAQQLRSPLVIGRAGAGVSERGQQVQQAARALVAGHDLLAMHAGRDAGGAWAGRSAWSPAVHSTAVSRAMAAEMGELAQHVAAVGASMAAAAPARSDELGQARQDMVVACRHLRMLAAVVRDAHQREPVPGDDRELLRAIPAAVALARRLPDGTEPVDALCAGVITAAERLRQSTWVAADRPCWSPSGSADALRYAAAAGVAVNHQCAELLRHLGDRAQPGELAGAVTQAGEAAGHARDGWLRVTRTLDQVTSDTRGHAGREVADSQDLALWTGRLAQASATPTLAGAGPAGQAERPAADLTGIPDDARAVVAAVHYASDAMSRLAELHDRQAAAAARSARFLAPSWSLPDYYGRSRPYGPAPTERVDAIRSAYREARATTSACEAQVGEVGEMVRSPSRALTLARKAVARSALVPKAKGRSTDSRPFDVVSEYQAARPPGHVEKALQVLGVTDLQFVRRAQDIDWAGEHLISQAAAERDYSGPAHRAELAVSVRDAPHHAGALTGHSHVMASRPAPQSARDSAERQAE